MANNIVDPSQRGKVKLGRGITQVTGTTQAKRGGEVVTTRVRETYLINASSPSGHILIADAAMELVGVYEKHSVVGGTSAALQLEKLTGTQAPGSGVTMLNAAIDLTATINTTVTPALTSTAANLQLAVGNSVAFKLSGTLTGLVGAVTLVFRRI